MKRIIKKIKLVHILLFIIIALLGSFFSNFLIVILLISIGAISMLHKHFKMGLGIEFVTFAAVVGGIKFGPWIGFLIGIVASLTGFIITADLHGGMFLAVGLFGLFGFLASSFSSEYVFFIGLTFAIIYDIVFIFKSLITGINPLMHTLFYSTHIIGNYWIFKSLAPFFF